MSEENSYRQPISIIDLYHEQIDNEGRIIIPLDLRRLLKPEDEDIIICTRAPGGAIKAYPKTGWHSYVAELNARQNTPETNRYKRLLYNTTMECQIDKDGGITLSRKLIEIAGIDKRVIIVDLDETFEIWDPYRLAADTR